MKDKVQKIREEVERMHNLLPVMDGDNIYLNYADRICTTLEMYIDSLQEESVKRTPADIEAAMQEVEEKSRVFTDVHKGEDADTILAQMRGKEPVSKDYRERYKRIAQSEEFKKTYEGMSVGEIMHVECEKPVSDIDFEQELYKAFGQVKDFTLGMQIAKRFYEMGKNNQEHVSEDLGEYINELSKQFPEVSFAKLSRIAVRVAKWKKQHLWKPADGEDLPIIDREVIALLDNGKVVFAHRPPEYWDGKDIITGKVTRYYPKTYDKGGWNIPNVKWWLDVYKLPNVEE